MRPERDTERELGDERVGAEGDHGRMQPGELLEVAGKVACLRKDAPGMLEHQLAGFRRLERTGRAAEQIHPERGLDRVQSLPKQFRREADRTCGAGDITGRQHREQVEQAG
jgi:hypothetical protein